MAKRILEMETTAGFLERKVIKFAPGLNCIIGARGTCKSTIVETLRFVFRQSQLRDQYILFEEKRGQDSNFGARLKELPGKGVIPATLTPGSARVLLAEVNGDEEHLYRIERDTVPASSIRVFKDDVPETRPEVALASAEIYSQGELHAIAKHPGWRLALVDRPNSSTIKRLRDQMKEKAKVVRMMGEDLRRLRHDLIARRASVAQLEPMRAALAEIQKTKPHLDDKLQRAHEAHLMREALKQKAHSAVSASESFVQSLLEATSERTISDATIELLKAADEASSKALAERLILVEKFRAETHERARTLLSTAELLDAMEGDFAQASQPYFTLMHQDQARQEVLKREAAYVEQIRKLEAIHAECLNLEAIISEKVSLRDAARKEIIGYSNQILLLRTEQIEAINEKYPDRIYLSLQPPHASEQFKSVLRTLLTGSSLRDQDGLADAISSALPPAQLIRAAEEQNPVHIAALLDKDTQQITRLLGHLWEQPELYSLEEILIDDELEITLYDQGKSKTMLELSKGQMATALLPLILREEASPLIIDQPEDDLDNSFIFDTLVEMILFLKPSRQIILVTHNANIPVLGEAERVIVMEMAGPTEIAAPRTGAVDDMKEDIIKLLEGGREAFAARASKYDIA